MMALSLWTITAASRKGLPGPGPFAPPLPGGFSPYPTGFHLPPALWQGSATYCSCSSGLKRYFLFI